MTPNQDPERVLVAAAKDAGLPNCMALRFPAPGTSESQITTDARLAVLYVLLQDLRLTYAPVVELLGGDAERVKMHANHAMATLNFKLRDFPERVTRIREQIAA